MSEAAAAGLKALGLRTSEAAAAGFVELGLRMSEAAALGFTASPWPLAPFAMPRRRTAATAREGHPIRIIVCLHSSSFPQRPAARPVPGGAAPSFLARNARRHIREILSRYSGTRSLRTAHGSQSPAHSPRHPRPARDRRVASRPLSA